MNSTLKETSLELTEILPLVDLRTKLLGNTQSLHLTTKEHKDITVELFNAVVVIDSRTYFKTVYSLKWLK